MKALSILVAGFIFLKIYGLQTSTYYKKQSAESTKKVLHVGIILLMLLGIPLSFSVYEGSQINPSVMDEAQEFFGEDLIDVRRSQGDLNVLVAGNASESKFEAGLKITWLK